MPNQRLGDKQHSFTVEMKVWKIENVWFNCIFLKKISPLSHPSITFPLIWVFYTFKNKGWWLLCNGELTRGVEKPQPVFCHERNSCLYCKTHYFDISCAQSNGDLFFSFSFFHGFRLECWFKTWLKLFPFAKQFLCKNIFLQKR